MYPLFESIKVVDGQCLNLPWHQRRVDQSRIQYWQKKDLLDLKTYLHVPSEFCNGVVKCRISYGVAIGNITYSHYLKQEIKSLQQVECEPFDYGQKKQDRTKLNQLLQLRGQSDEILITHSGRVTDSSYSNVALFDGSGWFTPERPLLEGTQRAKLLYHGLLTKMDIHITDLVNFEKLVLINAMLEFEPKASIAVGNVRLWDQPRVVF